MEKFNGKNLVICKENCPRADFCIANHPCGIEQAIIDELSAYKDTGLTPEEVAHYKAFADKAVTEGVTMGEIKWFIGGENQKLPLTTGFSIRHLIDLGRAEREGRLVMLPCKVGSKIWTIVAPNNYKPYVADILDPVTTGVTIMTPVGLRALSIDDFGKKYFTSREAAETALKERERGRSHEP